MLNEESGFSFSISAPKDIKTSPNIPDNISTLYCTFAGCQNLTSAPVIPNSITNLACAFMYCCNLTSVPTIPANVTDMHYAFFNCYNLKGDVTIQSDIVSECVYCFENHNPEHKLNLYIHKDTKTWNTFKRYLGGIDNKKLNIHMKELEEDIYRQEYGYLFVKAKYAETLTKAPSIPNNVTDMCGTFHNCRKLTEASTIPNSVTNMYSTFASCWNLTSAPVIPDSVTDMSATFEYCTNLTKAPVIPNSVTNMSATFFGCCNLKGDVYIYSDKVRTCDYCFACHKPQNELNLYIHKDTLTWNTFKKYLDHMYYHADALNIHMKELEGSEEDMYVVEDGRLSLKEKYAETLTKAPNIPNNVTSMIETFADCVNLTEAPSIPNSVTNMYSAFSCCFKLTKPPIIPNSVTNMYNTFSCCRRLTIPPVIPNSVVDISYTFFACSNLTTSPVIPDSVKNMDSTFYDCSNLKGDIYIYSDNVEDCDYCFAGHNPKNELNLYIHKDTKTWNTFKEYLGGIDSEELNIHMKAMGYEPKNAENDFYELEKPEITLRNYINKNAISWNNIERYISGFKDEEIRNYFRALYDKEKANSTKERDICQDCTTIAEFSIFSNDVYRLERIFKYSNPINLKTAKFKLNLNIHFDIDQTLFMLYTFNEHNSEWKYICGIEAEHLNIAKVSQVENLEDEKFQEALRKDVTNILNIGIQLLW